MRHSSTSSSDGSAQLLYHEPPFPPLPRGVPWAFLLALVILAGVEAAVRVVESRGYIPYAPFTAEYHAIRNTLLRKGPADVCILGSSRGKEGLVMPDLLAALRGLPEPWTAANYSAADARSRELKTILAYLLRRGQPKLVLVAISDRELLQDTDHPYELALFWTFDDWREYWRAERTQGAASSGRTPALDLLPVLIRNHLGNVLRIVRYSTYGDLLAFYARFRFFPTSGLTGDLTYVQAARASTLVPARVMQPDDGRVYIDAHGGPQAYRLNPARWADFRDMARLCREAGVMLVFVEVPVADLLIQAYPPVVYEQFIQGMRELSRLEEVPFLRPADYGFQFREEHFDEPAHLNYHGARIFTRFVFDQAIQPAWTRWRAKADPIDQKSSPSASTRP